MKTETLWLAASSLALLFTACSDPASEPPAGDAAGAQTGGAATGGNPGDGVGGSVGGMPPGNGGQAPIGGGDPFPTGGTVEPGGGAGGAGGTGGGAGGVGGAAGGSGGMDMPDPPTSSCPADAGTLDLSGAQVQQVQGVPAADGYGEGFSILEGPVWYEGALYFTHIASNDGQPPPGRILKLVPDQAPEIVVDSAAANGLAIGLDGQLLVARHFDGSISRLNVADGMFTPVAAMHMDARFNSPNDLTVRSDGNIYFTDPNYQAPNPAPQAQTRVYRIDPAGAVTSIIDDAQQPNGVTLSLDENTLYLSGQGAVMSYPVMADGSIGAGAQFANVFSGDGMVLDCAGNLYVTNNGQVSVVDSSGADVGTLMIEGAQAATNVAFGGPERKTLYITSLDTNPKLFKVDLNVPGMPY